MTFPFQPASGLVHVNAEITGPAQSVSLRLLLDTGATQTVLNTLVLARAGVDTLDPLTTRPVQITTGSGTVTAVQVVLTRLSALGQHRFGFTVTAHDLPPSANADGVLGLISSVAPS